MFTKCRKGRVRGMQLLPNFYTATKTQDNTSYLLIALESARITSPQLESARRVISKQIKKVGIYKAHIKPSTSVSAKPSEVRMGKGKGAISHYISRVKAGQTIFSIECSVLTSMAIQNILKKAAHKLPLDVKIFIY